MFESLKKWNPFKFKREEQQEEPKKVEVEVSQEPVTGLSQTHPMSLLRRDMDRMFERFLNRSWSDDPFQALSRAEDWFGDFSPARFQPKVDVVEEKKHLIITAELPGLSAEDVEVSIRGNMLALKGEKTLETSSTEDGCYRTERAYGSFQRTIPLPVDIAQDACEANFDKGILTLRFPKVEKEAQEEEVRKIQVS